MSPKSKDSVTGKLPESSRSATGSRAADVEHLRGYMPTLDGWRAISIALVLIHHSHPTSSIPVVARALQALSRYGGQGVAIFFAISGILICGRLLEEERKHGILLKKFYIRRAFRIFPAAWCYLLALLFLASKLQVLKLGLVSALLFFRNYVLVAPWRDWYTAHFWSLAVEEHFYLLLPGLLVLFPKRRATALAVLAFAVIGWRSYIVHKTQMDPGEHTDTVLDALLIPAWLAVVMRKKSISEWLYNFLKPAVSLVLAAAFIFLLVVHVPFAIAMRSSILPLILLSTCLYPESWFGRFLESAPLRWSGRLSYSLYLWQQLFFYGWAGSGGLGVMQSWPLNLAELFACATLSYYLIERPMVRLAHKWAPSGVPGRSTDQPETFVAAAV